MRVEKKKQEKKIKEQKKERNNLEEMRETEKSGFDK